MDELRQPPPAADEDTARPEETEKLDDEALDDDDGETVVWDGSEAELVLDDDAANYEEPQTGFKLSYTLREREVFRALEKSGFCRTMGRRAVVECAVLAVLAVWFFAAFAHSGEGMSLFFGIVAVLAFLAAALVPYLARRKRAREICADKRRSHVDMEIYSDGIQIGSGEGEWEIPFDGSCRREEHRNLVLLFPAGGKQMVILPLRCIEPAVLPEVQAMILAGTTHGREAR